MLVLDLRCFPIWGRAYWAHDPTHGASSRLFSRFRPAGAARTHTERGPAAGAKKWDLIPGNSTGMNHEDVLLVLHGFLDLNKAVGVHGFFDAIEFMKSTATCTLEKDVKGHRNTDGQGQERKC